MAKEFNPEALCEGKFSNIICNPRASKYMVDLALEYYLADHRKEELAKVYKESIEAEYRQECEFLNLMEGQKYESY